MIETLALDLANVSDAGLKRPHNEDSAVTDSELGLVLVADGMGGYKAGEVASAIAAKIILDGVRAGRFQHQFVQQHAQKQSHEAQLLKGAIESANRYILETAQKIPQCQGMGTTVVAALFAKDRITIAHVGDSRMYRLRGGEFKQLTNDHSLVQELIDRGFFASPEEAQANTPKNLVTRALGIDEQVMVDVQELATSPDDIYLLCSDGLNDMVNDEEIRLTLSKYSANLLEAARQLVANANASGGKDNISVVLARPGIGKPTGGSVMGKIQRLWSKGS